MTLRGFRAASLRQKAPYGSFPTSCGRPIRSFLPPSAGELDFFPKPEKLAESPILSTLGTAAGDDPERMDARRTEPSGMTATFSPVSFHLVLRCARGRAEGMRGRSAYNAAL
jgi:hypothetical protein